MSIEDFNAELEDLLAAHDQLLQDWSARRNAWIASMWPKYKLGHFQIGLEQWPCKDSPIEICIYDVEEDYLHDECIFCGQPEERD
jgi:hypothetical protein